MSLPKFIALCGRPGCGKSTTTQILDTLYGYKLVDDGGPMRRIAMAHFGASYNDVYTQPGKLSSTLVNGQLMTWRDVLGRLGNGLEAQFGADVIPELAYRNLPIGQRFVFGSVRREQGLYHKNRGALIIEIENPGVGESPYEFDRYNKAHVDLTIVNKFGWAIEDGEQATAALRQEIVDALGFEAPEQLQAAE